MAMLYYLVAHRHKGALNPPPVNAQQLPGTYRHIKQHIHQGISLAAEAFWHRPAQHTCQHAEIAQRQKPCHYPQHQAKAQWQIFIYFPKPRISNLPHDEESDGHHGKAAAHQADKKPFLVALMGRLILCNAIHNFYPSFL